MALLAACGGGDEADDSSNGSGDVSVPDAGGDATPDTTPEPDTEADADDTDLPDPDVAPDVDAGGEDTDTEEPDAVEDVTPDIEQDTDAGGDVEPDVGTDTIEDVGTDTIGDVGTDTVEDVGTDTIEDVGTDTVEDVGTDTAEDVGTDTGSDVAEDTSIGGDDTGGDAGSDAVSDVGPDVGEDTDPGLGNIIEVARADGRFTLLLQAIELAGLTETLEALDTRYTVFAPPDDVFGPALRDLDTGIDQLNEAGILDDILLYHVLAGTELFAADLGDGPVLTAAQLSAWVNVDPGVRINDANVIIPDVDASNGVIHAIDSVLLPATVAELAVFSELFPTLLTAVETAGLFGALDATGEGTPITLFAPTEAAFAQLLADNEITVEQLLALEGLPSVLLYHVMGGALFAEEFTTDFYPTLADVHAVVNVTDGAVFVNQAEVVVADIVGTNGVLHVVDSVLVPATLGELVFFHPDYSTLFAAVEAAELVGPLVGFEQPLTLFAPDNLAFDNLLETLAITAEELLLNEGLPGVLLYHLLGDVFDSAAILDAVPVFIGTGGGLTAVAQVTGSTLFVNDAAVTRADIFASNGILHVIDSVLLPTSTVETLRLHPDFTTLVAAIDTADVADVVGTPNRTLFAPTNAAFEALAALLEVPVLSLLELPNLAEVLAYHVYDGRLGSENLESISYFMVSGAPANVDLVEGTIAGQPILATDLETATGIFHIIDGVMLPPEPARPE